MLVDGNGIGRHRLDIAAAAIVVDEGPQLKRLHARAKGRANRIIKRTSHITVIVGDGRAD